MQLIAKKWEKAQNPAIAYSPDPYLYVTIKEFPVSTEFLKLADRGDL